MQHRLTILAALALLTGCITNDGIAGTGVSISFALTPSTLALRVGDTASVVANVSAPTHWRTTTRWSSASTAIVVVDTAQRAAGAAAVVRAVAPGQSAIFVQIIASDGSVVSASVPVTVSAR